ncbi:hypothetical protein D3C86_2111540 [compost metagenome]
MCQPLPRFWSRLAKAVLSFSGQELHFVAMLVERGRSALSPLEFQYGTVPQEVPWTCLS